MILVFIDKQIVIQSRSPQSITLMEYFWRLWYFHYLSFTICFDKGRTDVREIATLPYNSCRQNVFIFWPLLQRKQAGPQFVNQVLVL